MGRGAVLEGGGGGGRRGGKGGSMGSGGPGLGRNTSKGENFRGAEGETKAESSPTGTRAGRWADFPSCLGTHPASPCHKGLRPSQDSPGVPAEPERELISRPPLP